MDMKHLLSTIDQLQSKEILNEGKEASYSPSYRVGKTGEFGDKPHMKRGTPVAGKIGKYGKTSDELGDPDVDPDAEKRSRGRPTKSGSEADTKDRYSGAKDLQNIMIGKMPKSLPGKKGQVHKSPQDKEVTESKSLKDWFERLDEALNEASLSPTQTLVPGMQTGSQKAQPTIIDVKNNPALKAGLDKAAKDKQLTVVGIAQPGSGTSGTGMTSGTSTTGMSGSSTGAKIAEKIEPPIKTNPAEKGKYSGKTVAELKKSLASVKARMASMKEQGKKVPHDLRGHFSELTFAIRAKQEGSGKWGAIKEADPPPDGGTISPLTLEGKKQHYDKGYYDSLAASKKDGAKSIVKSRKDAVAEEKTSTRDNRAEKAGRRVTKDLEYDMYHHGKDDNKAERAGRKVTKDIEYDEKHHHFYEEKTVTRDNRAEKAGRKVTKDIEYDEKVKDKIHGKKREAEDQKAERAGRKVTKDIEYDEKKLPTMAHVKKMCKDGLTVAQILKMHPKCDATALKKMISDCKKKMVKEGITSMKNTFAILDDSLLDQIANMNGAEVDPDAGTVETWDENTFRQLNAFAQKNPSRLKRTQSMNTAGMRPMARQVGGTATGPEYNLKEGRDQHLHAAYHEGKSHGLSKMPYSCRHDDMEEARMYHEGYKCGLDECYGQQPIVGYVGEETDSDIVDTMASYGARGMEEGVLGTLAGGALGAAIGGPLAAPLGAAVGAGLGQAATSGGSSLIERLDPSKRERLDQLIDQFHAATEPGGAWDFDEMDDEEVIAQIRQEFGDKIADQVASGSHKMHFGRQGMQRPDLLSRKNPARITKGGKMFRQDMDTRKRDIKQRFGLEEDDLDEVSRGEYMKQKAKTTPGDTFKAFGQTFRDSDVLDELAFESLDKQLNALLNEGVSVSISQGQQGAPNSVNVNATDAEADKLLAFVKQAGLGIFGSDAGSSDSSMPTDKVMDNSRDDDAEITVVDDHEDMLNLIRKMTGQGPAKSSDDYEDEESHSDHEGTCSTCHSDPCDCEEQIDEVQSEDQMTYQVAEDDAAAQNAANVEAGAEAEAAADKSEEAETSADEHTEAEEDMAIGVSHGGNGKTYGGDEEELEESYANAADDDFEADINFMTKVISGGLNKQKSTGQTTIPVISGQTDRMGYSTTNESLTDWKKLAGLR